MAAEATERGDATATVREVRDVGPGTVAVALARPAGFDADPGQFVKLGTTVDGEHVERFYTVSSPRVEETVEVTVGVDPDGDLGPALADAAAGTTVTLAGPFGETAYRGDGAALALAGGPGIGAGLAVAERATRDGHDAALVFRGAGDVHADRLDALRRDATFVSVAEDCLDRRVRAADEALHGEGAVYVYGFSDFVDDAEDALDAAGVAGGRVRIERFD